MFKEINNLEEADACLIPLSIQDNDKA